MGRWRRLDRVNILERGYRLFLAGRENKNIDRDLGEASIRTRTGKMVKKVRRVVDKVLYEVQWDIRVGPRPHFMEAGNGLGY